MENLRNSKEFVNHKILDCIGDLYTCGFRMLASVVCSQGGHFLTNKLLRKVYLKIKKIFQLLKFKREIYPTPLLIEVY